jgi:SAM-dependent methyltransferase
MEETLAGSCCLSVLLDCTDHATNPFVESQTMTEQLLPQCICGSKDSEGDVINAIPVLRCTACGVIRQQVTLTLQELGYWYKDKYFNGVYTHSYDHDVRVADLRLKAYGLEPGVKLLDVGCGNSAFVDAARLRGLDAWGQDLSEASDGPYTYVGDLVDVSFPTDAFDVLTIHDVLEHHPRPRAFLRECSRVLRPGGRLIVDFPRFHHERGKHHWKLIEHLWMLDEAQLTGLLETSGFKIKALYHPLTSKIVVFADRIEEKRPQILVPSGIGDAYWVLTKLPGFLRANNLGMPDVWVQDAAKGVKRAEPFLQTIPFVHAAGYKLSSPREPIFHEAYFQNQRTVFPGALEVDYFIAYNGVMRWGASLEQVDPQFGCDWFPKMHFSKEARGFEGKMQLQTDGDYAVAYFVQAGMYGRWLAEFTFEQIQDALRAISAQLGLKIVVIGAGWDKGSLGERLALNNPDFINLVGQTTYDQLLGTLRGSRLVIGYPSGASILGPVLRKPTVLFWNRYFNRGFWVNSVPPGTPYRALDTADLTVDAVVAAAREVMGR